MPLGHVRSRAAPCPGAAKACRAESARLSGYSTVRRWGGGVPWGLYPTGNPLRRGRGCTGEVGALFLHPLCCVAADALQPHPSDKWLCRSAVTAELPVPPRARCPADRQCIGQGTSRSPGGVWGGWKPGAWGDGPLPPQGAVLSQLLQVGAHLDGVLLEDVTVLGVTSPPRQVLANGALVGDFSYRSDTQASARPRCGRGRRRGRAAGRWLGRDLGLSRGAGGVWPQ